MIYVLTRRSNAPSATRLGYPVVGNIEEVPTGSRVIRWGMSGQDRPRWGMVLNKGSAVSLAVDKLASLQAMARSVTVPDIYLEGVNIPPGVKAVVRPENHSEGSDFELSTGPLRVPLGYHATRFIEGTREYRVWFVRGDMLVAKRVPRTSQGQSESDPCRSSWGYEFVSRPFEKLAAEVAKARLAIPLDFGAIDVLWKPGSPEGKWYFLEMNTAPSLDHDRVLEFFKTKLSAILGAQDAERPSEATRRAALEGLAEFGAAGIPRSCSANTPTREIERQTPPATSDEAIRAKVKAKIKADWDRIYQEELSRM